MKTKIAFSILMVSFICEISAHAQNASNKAHSTDHGVIAKSSVKSAARKGVAQTTAKGASRAPASSGKVSGNRAPASVAQSAASTSPAASSSIGGGRGPASVTDSNNALEVRGQSRNLSMMLTLRNRGSDINFVKPRENYKSEIQNTSY